MRRGGVVAAGVAALLLAGCGGGDKGGANGRLTAAQYRAQATRICQAARRETDALGRPKTTAQFKRFLARGLIVSERNLRRLSALRPPADLQSEHDAIVAGEREGITRLQQVSDRLHGDARDVALLKRVQPALAGITRETDRRYRAAGLTACAGPASS